MENGSKLNKTEKVMMCDNCGAPVIQSEVDENNGKCPNCNEIFKPSNKSGE